MCVCVSVFVLWGGVYEEGVWVSETKQGLDEGLRCWRLHDVTEIH